MGRILLILSSLHGHLGCFYVLTILSNSAMNMSVQKSLQDTAFNSFGSISRSGIAGSYGSSTFNFLRNCHCFSQDLLSVYQGHRDSFFTGFPAPFPSYPLLPLRGTFEGSHLILPLKPSGAHHGPQEEPSLPSVIRPHRPHLPHLTHHPLPQASAQTVPQLEGPCSAQKLIPSLLICRIKESHFRPMPSGTLCSLLVVLPRAGEVPSPTRGWGGSGHVCYQTTPKFHR